MDYALPTDGGCWFCFHKGDDHMEFSYEFDTYFHEGCCLMAVELGNPEAEIMMRELEDNYG